MSDWNEGIFILTYTGDERDVGRKQWKPDDLRDCDGDYNPRASNHMAQVITSTRQTWQIIVWRENGSDGLGWPRKVRTSLGFFHIRERIALLKVNKRFERRHHARSLLW